MDAILTGREDDVSALRDAGIAIAMVVLTIVFDFVTLIVSEPHQVAELQQDHAKMMDFLGKPFDLWTVAFTLLVGAALSTAATDRNKLIGPAIAAAVALLLILASIGLNAVYGGITWKVVVPDLFAIALIGFTVNRAAS